MINLEIYARKHFDLSINLQAIGYRHSCVRNTRRTIATQSILKVIVTLCVCM